MSSFRGEQYTGELASSVQDTLSLLSRPFLSKSFGPKTMEMYVVFASTASVPLEEIEKYERDVRVCRKIVITDQDDLNLRLAFLRPLDELVSSPLDLETMFWAELSKKLAPHEEGVLRELENKELKPEEIARRLRERQ